MKLFLLAAFILVSPLSARAQCTMESLGSQIKVEAKKTFEAAVIRDLLGVVPEITEMHISESIEVAKRETPRPLSDVEEAQGLKPVVEIDYIMTIKDVKIVTARGNTIVTDPAVITLRSEGSVVLNSYGSEGNIIGKNCTTDFRGGAIKAFKNLKTGHTVRTLDQETLIFSVERKAD